MKQQEKISVYIIELCKNWQTAKMLKVKIFLWHGRVPAE